MFTKFQTQHETKFRQSLLVKQPTALEQSQPLKRIQSVRCVIDDQDSEAEELHKIKKMQRSCKDTIRQLQKTLNLKKEAKRVVCYSKKPMCVIIPAA